ncbi:MAG: EAL domain-containing protein [Campylobacterota bacterium]|nr:EAL domain-containing protein [Campylobacterota bacterium]
MFLKKPRLYFIIAILTTLVVMGFMGVYSYFQYSVQKKELVISLKEDSKVTLLSLQKNLSHFIESYAVNDYEVLLRNEMQHQHFSAIIVEDFNMAKITGKETYTTGQIRNNDTTIEQYKNNHISLDECYYYESAKIISSMDEEIGLVSICSSDLVIQQNLLTLVKDSVIVSLFFSFFLSVALFFILRRFTIAPITHFNYVLSQRDDDGIPMYKVEESNIYEFEKLSQTVNLMIDSVKNYRKREKENIIALKMERERFQLAIDGSQDGLWDWDPRTDEVFFSSQWKRMIGFEDHEITNKLSEWSDRVHPEDIDSAMESVKKHLDGKTDVYEHRHRMRCKDGSWKWILDRGKALFNKDGKALRFVGFHSDITEQVEHQKALEHSAKHDSLTHLPNRFLFNELIQTMLSHTIRNKKSLAIIYIDLDGFKEVNDTYGHKAGDVVLTEVSQRMKDLLRQEDVISRLGGDEFVVAIGDITKNEDIIPLLKRLLEVLSEPISFNDDSIKYLQVSASIGVSIYPQEIELGPEALLRQADQAMYEAKNAGKNQYRFFDLEENQLLRQYQEFLIEFTHAIASNELELHYQPKVDMKQGKVLGVEALVRWNHSEKGLLYPDDFLPQLNANEEIMLKLGRWVVKTAIEQLSFWLSKDYTLSMNINISSHEFNNKETLPFISSLLEKYKIINPSQIELEILETHALQDINMAHQMIQECHLLGLSIALDDFGTGYSTMSYLKELPVNTLKIDKSFVIEMLNDSGSFSILEAAVGLSHAFHCETIAEGVESEEHGKMLIELGCTIGQGYIIAKPMNVDAFEIWLQEWQPFDSWIGMPPCKLDSC